MTVMELLSVTDANVGVKLFDAEGINPIYDYDPRETLPEWIGDMDILSISIDEEMVVCVDAYGLDSHFSWSMWDDNSIVVDNKVYPVEMTLDPRVPDNMCNRVMIDWVYYYF